MCDPGKRKAAETHEDAETLMQALNALAIESQMRGDFEESRRLYARSASYAIAGPRSLPPIPMLTTLRIRRSV